MTRRIERGNPQGNPQEVLPGAEKILWRRGEVFQAAPISDVVGVKEKSIVHPLYGRGIQWNLGSSRNLKTKLEFFEAQALLRVGLPLGTNEFQNKSYSTDAIATAGAEVDQYIVIFCSQPGGNTRINIYPNGDVDEFHRQGTRPIHPHVREVVIRPINETLGSPLPEVPRTATVSVKTAAAQLQCSEAWVRQLAERGKLGGQKIGREWWIDAEALARFPRSRSPVHQR